jgi:hypothetical protein
MAHHIATALDLYDASVVSIKPELAITPTRYAIRVLFKPFTTISNNIVTTIPEYGWYAEIPAPEHACIESFGALFGPGVTVNSVNESKMSLSLVDPAVSRSGAFLYTFVEDIRRVQGAPSLLYRKTEIPVAGYSTNGLNESKIYALLHEGPFIPQVSFVVTDPAPPGLVLPADIVIIADIE